MKKIVLTLLMMVGFMSIWVMSGLALDYGISKKTEFTTFFGNKTFVLQTTQTTQTTQTKQRI